jgi:regulator of RNase E activity RraA
MSEPLTQDDLGALRRFSTPTICNAIETFNVRRRTEGFMDSTIVCRFPELGPMVAHAVTVRIRAGEPAEREIPHPDVWRAFETVPRPWVVVVEDLDMHPVGSYWGEVNASTYSALGAVGCITNGGVRDLPEVRPLGFHFFSAHVLVSHAYVHVVEVGGEVRVGGLTVRPGDLIHADQHGVTTIPPAIARDLPAAAARIESAERSLIDYARSDSVDIETLADMYGRVD